MLAAQGDVGLIAGRRTVLFVLYVGGTIVTSWRQPLKTYTDSGLGPEDDSGP